jgi:oligopeptide transport system substrate-binding protein
VRARSVRSTASLISLLGCLLAGCGLREEPADLVIINGAEPESLDPQIISGQPELRIVSSLFEGLTRFNARTGEPEPAIASRWEISNDGRTYIFHLRTNAVWSTGEPIVAGDVVWSWLRALEPETASDYVGLFFYVQNAEAFHLGQMEDPGEVGVSALDEHTLLVELVSPTAFFLSLCAFPTLAVVPPALIEAHGDQWVRQHPLKSSGAYTLDFWRINDRIRIRRNPLFWDNANTQNEIVDLLPITSATTALNLYLNGQADIVWDKNLVPVHLTDALRERPDFHTFDYLGAYFVRFNVTRKPFDDVRVRQAFAMSIDRRRIVDRVTRGGEKPSETLVPVSTANYLPADGLQLDPVEARRLLAEAGYPEGRGFPPVSYLLNAGSSASADEKVAVELQAMWREVLGVEVNLRPMEWKTYLATLSSLDYDLARSSWIADYNDPNTFLDMFLASNGNNRTGWKDPHYDELIQQANRTVDLKQRAEVFKEAESYLLREGTPIGPIYSYAGFNYYDPEKIEGIYDNPIDQHPINTIRKRK